MLFDFNWASKLLKKHIPKDSMRTAAVIFLDMGVFWILPEVLRSMQFEESFYSDPIFIKETNKLKN